MNRLSSVVIFAAAQLVAIQSNAGEKFTSPTPVTVSLSSRYAYGALGLAHNSSDVNSKIGCSINSNGAIVCSAADSQASQVPSCTISAPTTAQTQAVMALKGDSYLYFSWDSNWKCTYIVVSNGSNFPIKAQ